MPPILAAAADISMITETLCTYTMRNFREEKCFRDHGAAADAGGAWEVDGP